jgi:hypothetical protein
MFKTIVLACSIAVPTECLEFHDTRGPYEMERQCKARAMEMSREIAERLNWMPKLWRCDKLKPGMLTQWNQSLLH